MRVPSLGREDPLEKEMVTHSSILAWKITKTEEPGGLYSPWGRKESATTEQPHFHNCTLGLKQPGSMVKSVRQAIISASKQDG